LTDLAVIIVSWNVRELVLNAIRTVRADIATSGLSASIWLVDNASSDGTVHAVREQLPDVQVIASAENLGFVRGNNAALRAIGFSLTDAGTARQHRPDLPRAVYLLNPDTITTPGATRALFDALMGADQVGLVGARLSYEDGSFQHAAFRFPGLRQLWVEFFPTPGRLIESRFNGRYPRVLYQACEPFPVDFVLGATMMLKRDVIERTNGFDEHYFMYCEEIDWAWRLHDAGYRVLCVPAAHVVHLAGKSTEQMRPQAALHLWTSRMRLYQTHHPAWKARAARAMIAFGMRRRIARTDDAALRAVYARIRDAALGTAP
jgi:hypothetical protein